jgi:hypothetical protein
MSQTNLLLSFWGYALETTAFTLNRVPTKFVEMTLYEIWTWKCSRLSFRKVWGCEAYVKYLMSDKLTPKSDKCFIGVFCTGKLWAGQDHPFKFRGGLVNYIAHYDLSWFRPLLRGNSPTSSGLILKMNRGYNGVIRELEKFVWWRGKWSHTPCPKGRLPFIDHRSSQITTN